MHNNKSYKKILVVLDLCVIGLFVFHYFMLIDIKNKNEKLSVFLSDLSLQENIDDYTKTTNKIIENLSSDMDSVNNYIISNSGDVEFIESLESMADSNGLTIKISTLGFEEDVKLKPSNITILKMKADIEGSWKGMYMFLEQLESLPFKTKISQFNFTNSSGSFGSDVNKSNIRQWRGSFEIRVLKYK